MWFLTPIKDLRLFLLSFYSSDNLNTVCLGRMCSDIRENSNSEADKLRTNILLMV